MLTFSKEAIIIVIKLNSYILPDPVIEKMKSKIRETKEKDIELGFGLCRLRNTNIIRTGDECTGTECELVYEKECPIGSYVGVYHTHPHTSSKPSIGDLETAYIDEVGCIGSVRDDNIKCFLRIGPMNHQVREEIIKTSKTVEEPLRKEVTAEEYQTWKNARDKILGEHFKEIEIR